MLRSSPYRRDHAVEQLAGAADERQSLDVFVAARRLADEHHARLWIAIGKHQPGRGVLQRAAVECLHQRAQGFKRRRGACGRARGGDCGVRRDGDFAARNGRHRWRAQRIERSWTRRGGRGNWLGLFQPVDRLVAKRAIDPGLEVKGQQLLQCRGGLGRQGHDSCNLEHGGEKWRLDFGKDYSLRYPGRAKPWKRNSMVVLPPKIGNNDF
ncbi:hypothetical protein ACVWY2_008307 [Bradyrhizobium sp. JR6.1]